MLRDAGIFLLDPNQPGNLDGRGQAMMPLCTDAVMLPLASRRVHFDRRKWALPPGARSGTR